MALRAISSFGRGERRIPVFRTGFDLAFLGNLWHELDEPGTVLAEMRRILRPGGRVAILDWRTDVAYPPGPPPEHRVAVSKTEATLKTDNWRNVWFHLLGQYSYLLVAAAE